VAMPRSHDSKAVQFAVGGRTLPPLSLWVKVTERFRGRTVRRLSEAITGRTGVLYKDLSPEQRTRISHITGKDEHGNISKGHRHFYFLLWPDEFGLPTRLIVWSPEMPFEQEEIEALLAAASQPIHWDGESELYLVPLPLENPLPRAFSTPSQVWRSLTPFVIPPSRHRFRTKGRLRPGETPDQVATKLLLAAGFPAPQKITVQRDSGSSLMRIHQTRQHRLGNNRTGPPPERPGFRLLIQFDQPVSGPIVIGESCHFGLGLFEAVGSNP